MKHMKLVLVLFALLGLAGLVFAQQQSSKTSQAQQNTASENSASGWGCPMWNSGWGNYMHNSGTRGPGWMMGNNNVTARGAYGPMGPRMMYTPDTAPTTGGKGAPQKSAPQQ